MVYISINGRIAKKKQIEKIMNEVREYLLPRLKRDVGRDVPKVTRCDNHHYALCLGDKDSAEIELARGSGDLTFTLDEIMLNLAHELVHAKQFIRGELHPSLNKWKRLDCSNVPYSRQPWEKEAYLLEDKLIEKFWNK